MTICWYIDLLQRTWYMIFVTHYKRNKSNNSMNERIFFLYNYRNLVENKTHVPTYVYKYNIQNYKLDCVPV